jgi:hypothetical protein
MSITKEEEEEDKLEIVPNTANAKFYRSLLTNSKDWVFVGAGAFGTVYKDKTETFAKKTSKMGNTCRKWVNEFQIAISIWQTFKLWYQRFNKVFMVEPLAYFSSENGTECTTIMKYIKPIYVQDFVLSTQLVITDDAKDENMEVKSRGRYVGYQFLIDKQLLTLDDVKSIIRDLGMFIALVHHACEKDGMDMEYLISSDKKVYVVDFDMVKNLSEHGTKETMLSKMVWAMDAENYFPKPKDQMYYIFKNAYLRIAQTFGKINLGLDVMALYEKENNVQSSFKI